MCGGGVSIPPLVPVWSALTLMSTVLDCEKRCSQERFTWSSHSTLSVDTVSKLPTRNASMTWLTKLDGVMHQGVLSVSFGPLSCSFGPRLHACFAASGGFETSLELVLAGVCLMCRSTLRLSCLQCLLVKQNELRKRPGGWAEVYLRAEPVSIKFPVVSNASTLTGGNRRQERI